MNRTESTTIQEFNTEDENGDFKRYSEYRSVDLDWIEEIPQDWRISKLRWACDFITDGSHHSPSEDKNGNKIYITVSDITDGEIDFESAKRISEEDFRELEEGDCRPQKGDVLISKDGTIGKVAVVDDDDFVVLSSLGILRPSDKVDPHYLKYFAESKYCLEQMKSRLKGSAITRITLEIINDLNFILPPKGDQENIVMFLDNEVEKIDKLIEYKRQLIDLLEEKRTALIKNSVSNGIYTDVEQKQSGVEWLGKIPEGWEVRDLRYLADIDTGDKDTKDAVEEGDYPFFVRSQTEERINSYSYNGEAVLTAGDGVGVGEVFHYIDGKFDYHQRVYKISNFNEEVDGKFVYYYLKANLKMEIFKNNAKSTVDSLRMPMFKSFPIAFGDIEEQQEIVNYIDQQNNRIGDLIEGIEDSIENLKEYRIALITKAVTGQIDIQGEV